MNELLPIIRRARRPLVVVDAPSAVVGHVAPVLPVVTKPVEPEVSADEPKADDAQVTPKRSER
jgi:hypothetical protein